MCLPICEYELFPLTEPLRHARPGTQPPQAPWGLFFIVRKVSFFVKFQHIQDTDRHWIWDRFYWWSLSDYEKKITKEIVWYRSQRASFSWRGGLWIWCRITFLFHFSSIFLHEENYVWEKMDRRGGLGQSVLWHLLWKVSWISSFISCLYFLLKFILAIIAGTLVQKTLTASGGFVSVIMVSWSSEEDALSPSGRAWWRTSARWTLRGWPVITTQSAQTKTSTQSVGPIINAGSTRLGRSDTWYMKKNL